eukprot:10742080-Prorocentrum_lima.AAC.1
MAVPQQLIEAAPEAEAAAVQVSVSVRTEHAEGRTAWMSMEGGHTPSHTPALVSSTPGSICQRGQSLPSDR